MNVTMISKKSTEEPKSANRTKSKKSKENSSLLNIDLIISNEEPHKLSQNMKSIVREVLKQKGFLTQKGEIKM